MLSDLEFANGILKRHGLVAVKESRIQRLSAQQPFQVTEWMSMDPAHMRAIEKYNRKEIARFMARELNNSPAIHWEDFEHENPYLGRELRAELTVILPEQEVDHEV